MNDKITILETAKILHKSQEFVRIGLQRGLLPIGTAIQISNKKWTYYISPKKLEEFTGVKVNEKTRENNNNSSNNINCSVMQG